MDIVTELFGQHSDELFDYLCRYTCDRSLAKDILSDVFVKLIKEIKKKGEADVNWRAWLYKVAANCSISNLRKQKVRRLFLNREKHLEHSHLDTPQRKVEMSEEGERIKKAVQNLSQKHRSVLIMRVYQEMSYQEISDSLGVRIGTVKSRINEAKKQVRYFLERL